MLAYIDFMNYKMMLFGFLAFILIGCSDSKPEDRSLVAISENITIELSKDLQYNPLQGIDSNVGEITHDNDESFYVFIDIGELAGSYVDKDKAGAKLGRAINQIFVYQKRKSNFLSGGDCCYFFTFPDIGPANFAAYDNQHIDDVICIVESLITDS